jgi:hypothetical protein
LLITVVLLMTVVLFTITRDGRCRSWNRADFTNTKCGAPRTTVTRGGASGAQPM